MDDLGLLLEELVDVCEQWYHLGLQLIVDRETLETIREQFSDPRDQLLETLKAWLTTSDNTSWKTLTHALMSMRKSRLAGSLEREYCLTKDMRDSKQLAVS